MEINKLRMFGSLRSPLFDAMSLGYGTSQTKPTLAATLSFVREKRDVTFIEPGGVTFIYLSKKAV